jgi:hypothetical protein
MPQSLPGPSAPKLRASQPFGAEPVPPSPFKRIAATITVIGVLYGAIYSIAEGTSAERFAQVGAAIGVLVYLLTFIDVLIGIGFLIACVALSPEMTMGEVGNLRLEDFLIPALLLSWVARAARDREPVIGSPLKGPALLYLSFMVVSTMVGITAGTTPAASSVLVVLKFVEYYLLFLLIVNNIRSHRDFKAMALFAVLAAGASAVLTASLGADASTADRIHGPSGETANIFGGFLLMHLGLALGFALYGRDLFPRVACGTAAILMAHAVLTTLSRTTYAAIGFSLLIVGVLLERRLLVLLLLGSFALLLVGSEAATGRTQDLIHVMSGGSNHSLDARIAAWDVILSELTGFHLFLGQGAGSVRLGDVDSEYFKVLADMGLIGFAIFLWAMVRIGRMSYTLYRTRERDTFGHAFSVGFLLAFVGILVHAVAATSFTSIRSMEGFIILCGLMACLHHHREEWREAGHGRPGEIRSLRS